MTEKTEEKKVAKKDKKGLIIGSCVTVLIIAIIVVVAILINKNSLNDSFFVSDGSKYVLNYTAEELGIEDEEYAPAKAHYVYFYSGDSFTDVKAYYEFENEETAKGAFDYLNENEKEEYKDISLKGKFVILTANESDYANMKPSDIEQQIKIMEKLDELDDDSADEEEEEDAEEEEE